MEEKDNKNYLAKVVSMNKDGKPVVQLYKLILDNNVVEYKECDIKPLDLDKATKEFSIVGMISV